MQREAKKVVTIVLLFVAGNLDAADNLQFKSLPLKNVTNATVLIDAIPNEVTTAPIVMHGLAIPSEITTSTIEMHGITLPSELTTATIEMHGLAIPSEITTATLVMHGNAIAKQLENLPKMRTLNGGVNTMPKLESGAPQVTKLPNLLPKALPNAAIPATNLPAVSASPAIVNKLPDMNKNINISPANTSPSAATPALEPTTLKPINTQQLKLKQINP